MAEPARKRHDAADLHRILVGSWPECLAALGIDPDHLRRRKQQPCPMCGGTDRFVFDDRKGRGDYFCRHCGPGDGFRLLMGVNGWNFPEAVEAVAGYLGLGHGTPPVATPRPAPKAAPRKATFTARVRDLLRTATTPDLVPDAVAYLESRRLWPLASNAVKAHIGVEYFRKLYDAGKAYESLGKFPALIGVVRDVNDEPVTAHVTYLEHGAKLDRGDDVPARKLLSPVEGRVGCAVRVTPLDGATLGIAEGVEDALAAHAMTGTPCWAALNTSLLAKFVPPPEVETVVIFADADFAGMKAAYELREQLDGRCRVELRTPQRKDFAADWEAQA